MQKPSYSLTRSAFWWSFIMAWGVILTLVGGALYGVAEAAPMAGIVVPSMVVMIAALLGIHRAFGSIDMKTLHSGGGPAS